MPENTDYKQEIKKLVEPQIMDSEIYDLTSRKETFPVRLKEMDDSLNAKMGGMQAAEENLKGLQVAKNDKENQMQAAEEKIQKHETDLYQIKNNKEYSALKQEMESIRADISLLEEDIIKFLDDIDAGKTQLDEEKKIFEEEKASVEKEKGSINAEEKQLDEQLAQLASKRAELSAAVDPGILGKYQKILDKRGRVALAKISEEFCGACNMHLRPQIINEAELKQDLVFCENCTRMLYIDD